MFVEQGQLGLRGHSDNADCRIFGITWIQRLDCQKNHGLFLFSFKLIIFCAFTLRSTIALDYFRNLPKSKVMERIPLLPHVHTFTHLFFFLEEQQKLLLLLCTSTFKWSIAIFPFFFFVSYVHRLYGFLR